MTNNLLQRECDFYAAMSFAEELLFMQYIDKDDYEKIRKTFLKKYKPLIAGSAEYPKSLT